MFGIERRNHILSLLHDKKSITVQEAVEMFEVTEETIRRDLRAMETQGLIVRTMAVPYWLMTSIWKSLEIREGINIKGKSAIGKLAASLVQNGDTLFLDASTSSLYVAKHLKQKKGLTVITNAERIILELASCSNINVISTGGFLRKKSLSCVGRAAESAVSSYHADKVFFSSKGFSPQLGATDSNEQESVIRKLMITHSKEVVYLCDHTKFQRTGYIATAQLSDITHFIADVIPPAEWEKEMDDKNVKVIYPTS